MKEVGGYIELDTYRSSMLHENGIKLNCGRNALAYVIKAKGIKKLWMPRFMCDSCDEILAENKVSVIYYSIGEDFKPRDIDRAVDEWLYIVNFYGQLSKDDITAYGGNVICDNAQAYFAEPISGMDTLYTCRKFFGVPDGAILYTDIFLEELPTDESFERMHFLLGRFERSASEFYQQYVDNNHFFVNEPIKKMSRLTENLLHGIDYDFVKKRRTENFRYLHKNLADVNELNLAVPEGAFMYPLLVRNGNALRKTLQAEKIYIPMLWPNVMDTCASDTWEYRYAKDILPLPVDQRYNIEDMEYIAEKIKSKMQENEMFAYEY